MFDWMKGKKWIEYISVVLVCAGIWLSSFLEKVTFEMRIGQIAAIIIGTVICSIYEYVNRELPDKVEELAKKRYVDAKTAELSFGSMIIVYVAVCAYAVAFEKNSLLMLMLGILFLHLLINAFLKKKFAKEFDANGGRE